MELDERMIKAYLLRTIADGNKKISSVLYNDAKHNGFQDGVELGMENISNFFTGGRFADGMKEIMEYKEERPNSNWAPYHFFDLPTLVSYSIYINMIVDKMLLYTNDARRSFSTKKDVIRAQEDTMRFFAANQNSRQTGGYNAHQAFGIERKYQNGRRVLAPQKPLSWTKFSEKYDKNKAKRELERYIDELFPTKKVEVEDSRQPSAQGGYQAYDLFSGTYRRAMQEASKAEEGVVVTPKTPSTQETPSPLPAAVEHARARYQTPKTETFVYWHKMKNNKMKRFELTIDEDSKEYYTDILGHGLTSFVAKGKDCELSITVYSNDMELYESGLPLCDSDGVCVNVYSGPVFVWKGKVYMSEEGECSHFEDEGM